MISYTADSHELHGELYYTPTREHAPGAMRDLDEWDTGKHLGQIPQPPHTYRVVGNILGARFLSVGIFAASRNRGNLTQKEPDVESKGLIEMRLNYLS